MKERLLTKPQDIERRTLAQEQGVVLSPKEYSDLLTGDLPHSVQDILNGESDPAMDKMWSKIFPNGSK